MVQQHVTISTVYMADLPIIQQNYITIEVVLTTFSLALLKNANQNTQYKTKWESFTHIHTECERENCACLFLF